MSASADSPLLLRQNWAIQSSVNVRYPGPVLSAEGYNVPATLPSTVFSALVRQHMYPDPYSGMNLRSVPGTTYTVPMNFSNIPMPPDSPFRHPWWYRTEFKLPAEYRGKTIWMGFDGINFRAKVWMNGRRIASCDKWRARGGCSSSL
jgi:exo-1,4-beta-D-glucosaminidase